MKVKLRGFDIILVAAGIAAGAALVWWLDLPAPFALFGGVPGAARAGRKPGESAGNVAEDDTTTVADDTIDDHTEGVGDAADPATPDSIEQWTDTLEATDDE